MDHVTKKYHVITNELVLFNEEYYVSVLKVEIGDYDVQERLRLFNELFAFSHDDIELEIDISEEEQGRWYLQLLVPYMLTLSDAALKRIKRGSEALDQYLLERNIQLQPQLLKGQEIYEYIRRYNPGLVLAEQQ